ncbi:MAG: bluetail domain-containing putative surface protein [Sphaerospermopsis kisseleviana]
MIKSTEKIDFLPRVQNNMTTRQTSTKIISSIYEILKQYAISDNFWTILETAFGTNYNHHKAASIRSQWQNNNFSFLPQVQVISSSVLGTANGGYAAKGNKIYLSDTFLQSATQSQINAVLLEEIGHYLDYRINRTDTKGDEGEYFSALLRGVTLSDSEISQIQNEDDRKNITLKGRNISLEASGTTVYQTIKLGSVNYEYQYYDLAYRYKVSDNNVVWGSRKGANAVLYLYNDSTTIPIANTVYSSTSQSDFSISGNTVVYAKTDGTDKEIYSYNGGVTTKLTNNSNNDYAPQISGSNIVWYSNDGTDVEIFRRNGTTTTQLTNNSFDEFDLKLSGIYAVWAGWDGNDYEIYLNNGTTTTQLTNNTTDDYSPVISANKVAWFNWNGTAENLFFNNGTTTTQLTNNAEVYNPQVSGDKVVYAKYNGTNYSLHLYNRSTNTTTQLASQLLISLDDLPNLPFQIDGNWVVWAENSGVLKLNNGTSTITLSSSISDYYYPGNFTVANNKVAWVDNPNSGSGSNIFVYDGTTTTQVTADGNYPSNVTIAGNSFVFQKSDQLYLARPSTLPGLSINNVTVVEGQTSPQNAVLTVTLAAASTTPVTVQYATGYYNGGDQSAFPGSDYTTTSGTLTFNAGETTKTISVPILNDNFSEPDKNFSVTLYNATGAVLIPGQNVGLVTITDTLQSNITTTLPAGVENLTLTGTANINGTGNSSNNAIRGNNGNNILDSGGGFDTLIGGLGNDTYIISSIIGGVSIAENANEGTDTVQSSIIHTLGANLENLTLTGTDNISGYGNELNNVITGNSGINYLGGYAGNDTLNGGTGADSLLGGAGNDTYIIDNVGDYVWENANEGTDTVQSSVTYTLGSNVENLTLTGTTAINGTGNTLNNVITGNTGNNNLNGGDGNDTLVGGVGKDTLTGGVGTDRFSYTTLTHSLLSSFDVITDFNATTGNDLFLVTNTRAEFNNVGTVATLDAVGISAKLTTTNFGANFAAQFSFGTRTFVAINDATAGFNATTDAIIEVTGLTGTLGISNFVTV